MRDDEPVEGIPRPVQPCGLEAPRSGRRLVNRPAIVSGNRVQRTVQSQTAGFFEKLQLQQRDGRSMQPAPLADEFADARMVALNPDESVGIEQDQRLGPPLNARPRLVIVQDQRPSSTAVSRISIFGRRLMRRAGCVSRLSR